jgi:hypothetical protein
MPVWTLASLRIATCAGAVGFLTAALDGVAVFGGAVGITTDVSVLSVPGVGSCADNETPPKSRATDKVHIRFERVFMVAIPWGVLMFDWVEEGG